MSIITFTDQRMEGKSQFAGCDPVIILSLSERSDRRGYYDSFVSEID